VGSMPFFSFSDLRLPQVAVFSIFSDISRLATAASRFNFFDFFFQLAGAASQSKTRLAIMVSQWCRKSRFGRLAAATSQIYVTK